MSEKNLKDDEYDIRNLLKLIVSYGTYGPLSFTEISDIIHPCCRPVFSISREMIIRRILWEKIRSGEYIMYDNMKVVYNKDFVKKDIEDAN